MQFYRRNSELYDSTGSIFYAKSWRLRREFSVKSRWRELINKRLDNIQHGPDSRQNFRFVCFTTRGPENLTYWNRQIWSFAFTWTILRRHICCSFSGFTGQGWNRFFLNTALGETVVGKLWSSLVEPTWNLGYYQFVMPNTHTLPSSLKLVSHRGRAPALVCQGEKILYFFKSKLQTLQHWELLSTLTPGGYYQFKRFWRRRRRNRVK